VGCPSYAVTSASNIIPEFQSSLDHVPGSFLQFRLLSKPVTTQDTKVEVLRRFINRKHGLHLSAYSRFDHTAGPYRSAEDYPELHEYSVTNYTFWLDLWQFLGIISSVPPTKVRSLSAVFPTHTYLSRRSWKRVTSRRFHDGSPAHV
jgi:hypothetical protein